MIMKSLVVLFGLICIIIVSTLSHALMQDIVDPITGRRVQDREARIMGMIGYIVSFAVAIGLYHYLFD